MYLSIAIIGVAIALWSLFDSETAPGVTGWRPYGITALVGLGLAIFFSPQPSPYLVAGESCLVSLVICTLGCGVLLVAQGDRPTRRYAVISRALSVTLLVVAVAIAYFLGGVPALCGAVAAILIMAIGAATLQYRENAR